MATVQPAKRSLFQKVWRIAIIPRIRHLVQAQVVARPSRDGAVPRVVHPQEEVRELPWVVVGHGATHSPKEEAVGQPPDDAITVGPDVYFALLLQVVDHARGPKEATEGADPVPDLQEVERVLKDSLWEIEDRGVEVRADHPRDNSPEGEPAITCSSRPSSFARRLAIWEPKMMATPTRKPRVELQRSKLKRRDFVEWERGEHWFSGSRRGRVLTWGRGTCQPYTASRKSTMTRRTPVPAFSDHRRDHGELLYVYPVVSRRAGGLSIGINLNPDKVCNFACAYCRVDHNTPPRTRAVDLDVLESELREVVEQVRSGELWALPRFSSTPEPLRRLNDFAFSGDGEPTTYSGFDEAVERVIRVREEAALVDAKVVLITDAACLHHAHVRRGLSRMDDAMGEIWGKLDVGTAEACQRVNGTLVPFQRVLKNLADATSVRPIVIQTMMLRINGHPPPPEEVQAYVARLQGSRSAER